MKLAPKAVALALIALGAAIAVAGMLKRVPSYESLQVITGRVEGVQTRRQAFADDENNVHVELIMVGAGGVKHMLAFRQPERRLRMLQGLAGRDIVARMGPGGELFELRVGQARLQSYMQTSEPLMMDKAWMLLCGAMFAAVGFGGLWLARRHARYGSQAAGEGLTARTA